MSGRAPPRCYRRRTSSAVGLRARNWLRPGAVISAALIDVLPAETVSGTAVR
ncbi:hypothetical protein WG936_03510 [Corynebacterium sp. H127]|uniref:hypothetical protein n=1 Tax=Corynebacterium sp. H127 TaxID=3133418 RepID=UPI0030B0B02C